MTAFGPNVARATILFVDDEAAVLDGFRRQLRSTSRDWELRFAGSVAEALAITSQDDIDVVVSDINMPGRDGFELLRAFGDEESPTWKPVIMVTGLGDAVLKRKALDLGAADLLAKPVQPEDLLARLHSAVRLARYRRTVERQNERLEATVAQRTAELANSRFEIIWSLARACEARDEITGNHVLRVALYTRALARELLLESSDVEALFLAAPLHDIGKIGIPDELLRGRGRLTPAEFEVMKQHTTIGAQILSQEGVGSRLARAWRGGASERTDNPILSVASEVALSHHERWDGKGYPHGLAGDDIPRSARIVSVADVYDALRSERSYKPAFSEEQSFAMVLEGAGTQFDPDVVTAFETIRLQLAAIREEFDGGDQSAAPSVLLAA